MKIIFKIIQYVAIFFGIVVGGGIAFVLGVRAVMWTLQYLFPHA